VANDLAFAIQGLAFGFAARTGLEIEVDVSDCGEVSPSVEAAIYRMAQEALANIHRHAGANYTRVRLVGRKRYLHLMIQDDGIGFDLVESEKGHSLGVGVMGMRERVCELGGRLSIGRAVKGTAITVSFPRQQRMVFAPRTWPL
jgi:signal transduction histidine kinase